MESLNNSPWYGWIFIAVMGIVNLILGFIVVPLRGELAEIKEKTSSCRSENGALLFHLDKETKRQDEDIKQVARDISEIKERSIRTEESLKEVKATNLRIENKIDKIVKAV